MVTAVRQSAARPQSVRVRNIPGLGWDVSAHGEPGARSDSVNILNCGHLWSGGDDVMVPGWSEYSGVCWDRF